MTGERIGAIIMIMMIWFSFHQFLLLLEWRLRRMECWRTEGRRRKMNEFLLTFYSLSHPCSNSCRVPVPNYTFIAFIDLFIWFWYPYLILPASCFHIVKRSKMFLVWMGSGNEKNLCLFAALFTRFHFLRFTYSVSGRMGKAD